MDNTEETKEEITEKLDAEIGECMDCDDAALMEQWAFELNI